MTFHELNHYADALVARSFENLDLFYNFSPFELKRIKEVGKWYAHGRLSNEAAEKWMTGVLSHPL